MLTKIINEETSINHNETYEGETIETKVQRIVENNEPIKDGAPLIYTERKDGVLPGYDIRTDRFEIAIEAMDALSKANTAKRMENIKERENKSDEPSQQTATSEENQ